MRNLKETSFGKWLVLEKFLIEDSPISWWLCKCTCGKIYPVRQGNLISGKSTGCKFCKNKFKKHGLAEKHRLYLTWKSMRSRCNNPNVAHYEYYGGRGISVDPSWDNFETFVLDMSDSFVEGLTLDRVDNNAGYSKSNCRWATSEEQTNNQSKNLRLFFEGSFLTEAQLARKTGVPRTTIQARRNRGATTEEMVYGFKRI